MVTWNSKIYALSDKASPRHMPQVGNPQRERKSSSSTPKPSARPLPDPEAIEKYTNNLPSARQAKVDSKAKTADLLGPSQSREKERTPKGRSASAVSRSTSRASSLILHSAAMGEPEDAIDDTVVDNKDVQSGFAINGSAPPGPNPLAEQFQKVMERLEEEAERRANEANERANRGQCELQMTKIENSNQGLNYLKELELLGKNYDKELSKLQSRKLRQMLQRRDTWISCEGSSV